MRNKANNVEAERRACEIRLRAEAQVRVPSQGDREGKKRPRPRAWSYWGKSRWNGTTGFYERQDSRRLRPFERSILPLPEARRRSGNNHYYRDASLC